VGRGEVRLRDFAARSGSAQLAVERRPTQLELFARGELEAEAETEGVEPMSRCPVRGSPEAGGDAHEITAQPLGQSSVPGRTLAPARRIWAAKGFLARQLLRG